jgi:transcription antitermination factor NusG
MMQGRDPSTEGSPVGDDWYGDIGRHERFDMSTLSQPLLEVARLQNGNGWTEAFKHAALAGSLGAVGGLLLGPIGAVGGLLTGLVMSTSVLQHHARETAQMNHESMTTVARERRAAERQAQWERVLEQRRKKAMEKNAREDEWTRFIADKKAAATAVLKTYNIARFSVAVVGKTKAVIEIPWHVPWLLRRQLNDALEAALQMHVASVPVRFCDGCGGKLAGPVTEALQCPLCGRLFSNLPTPVQTTAERPHVKVERKPASPQPEVVHAILHPSPATEQEPPVEEAFEVEDYQERAAAESTNILTEYQTWDPLEPEDYRERMALEAAEASEIMRTVLNEKTKPTTPAPYVKPQKTPVPPSKPVETSSTQKEEQPTAPATAPAAQKPPAASVEKTAAKTEPQATAGIVEGGRAELLGNYKDLKGTIQMVDKKKHRAKVLLDEFGTTVNVPFELLRPLEVATE